MLIFIAEANEDLRLGLQMLLQRDTGMHVIGMAVRTQGLVTQVEASQADVLILDWKLPGGNMTKLFSEISGLAAPPKVIVLAVNSDVKVQALAAGADGFISKNALPNDLLEVVQSFKKSSVDSINS